MKKLLFALVGLCLMVASASADWRMEDLKWTHPGATYSTGASQMVIVRGFLRDTTWLPLTGSGAAVSDTSTEFSMLDCSAPSAQIFGHTSTADTLTAAVVYLVADSSVSSTIVTEALVWTIQANYSQTSNAQWVTINSGTVGKTTSGHKVQAFPIYTVSRQDTDLSPDVLSPMYVFAPRLRVIITSAGSVAMPSARLRVKKWYEITRAGKPMD